MSRRPLLEVVLFTLAVSEAFCGAQTVPQPAASRSALLRGGQAECVRAHYEPVELDVAELVANMTAHRVAQLRLGRKLRRFGVAHANFSFDELHKLDSMSSEIYRYMNFDQIESFHNAAEEGKLIAAQQIVEVA